MDADHPSTGVNFARRSTHDYPALLRARRRRARWSEDDQRLYQRHLWRSEGFHGEAKTWHGLGRAIRRGLDNMKIQAYLTGDQSQAACRRPSCRPVGHLGTPRRRNGTLKARPRPQQPNQPPNGRCRIVLHSPRSDGGFFNNPTRGRFSPDMTAWLTAVCPRSCWRSLPSFAAAQIVCRHFVTIQRPRPSACNAAGPACRTSQLVVRQTFCTSNSVARALGVRRESTQLFEIPVPRGF